MEGLGQTRGELQESSGAHQRLPGKDNNDHDTDLQEFLEEVDNTVKQGRASISEAQVLNAVAKGLDDEEMKELCKKLIKELARVDAGNDWLHPTVYTLMQGYIK